MDKTSHSQQKNSGIQKASSPWLKKPRCRLIPVDGSLPLTCRHYAHTPSRRSSKPIPRIRESLTNAKTIQARLYASKAGKCRIRKKQDQSKTTMAISLFSLLAVAELAFS